MKVNFIRCNEYTKFEVDIFSIQAEKRKTKHCWPVFFSRQDFLQFTCRIGSQSTKYIRESPCLKHFKIIFSYQNY